MFSVEPAQKVHPNPSFNLILALCVKHTNGDGSQTERWKSTKITDIYTGLLWSTLNDTQKKHSLITKGIKSGFPSERAKLQLAQWHHHLTERVPLSKPATYYSWPATVQLEMTEFLALTDLLNRFINFMLYIKYKHHNSVILVFFSTCFLVLIFQ